MRPPHSLMQLLPDISQRPSSAEPSVDGSAPAREPLTTIDASLLGRTVAGRYRMISRLGGGTSALGSAVYLARHVVIDRLSAIKVLTAELSTERQGDTEGLRASFLRQARAVNRINHPNLVEISDYGETSIHRADGSWVTLPFLVMEYVPGDPLRRLIDRKPLRSERVVAMAVQLASALARAHQTGVIHRDVRADNVLVLAQKGGQDIIKLTDFGLSRIVSRQATDHERGVDRHFGHVGYVPPDVLLGATDYDARGDIWCLGVLMYEALTGRHPFEGSSPLECQARALTDDPLPPSKSTPGIAQALDELVVACLAREPGKRPHDAFAVLQRLEALSSSWPPETLRSPQLEKTMGESLPSIRREQVDEDVTEIQPVPLELLATMMPTQVQVFEAETARRIPVSIPATQQVTRPIPEPPNYELLGPRALGPAWREFWTAVAPNHIEALGLLHALETTAQQVDELQHGIDALEAQVRADRAELGRDIDELAASLSRAHGHLLQLRIRYHEISSVRVVVPANMRPPLDHERSLIAVELARTEADVHVLGGHIAHVQDQLHARNLAHESLAGQWIATLEGALAALVRLHRELSEHAACCN